MSGRLWTRGEDQVLRDLIARDAPREEMVQALPGRTLEAIRWRANQFKKGEHPQQPSPDWGPPEEPLDVLGWIDEAHERTKDRPKHQDYRRIVIETDDPVAIMKAADFHFGGLDVDYQSLRDHVEFLLDAPMFYVQLYGDIGNYMIQHRVPGARRDVMGPEEQFEFELQLLHDTLDRNKLISVGSGMGTHDDSMIENTSGISLTQVLCGRKVPYFRGMGYIDLVLRTSDGTETTYRQGFVHKVRFSSFMNPLHGAKRMQQLHAEFFGRDRPICHEYVTAHTHYPGHSTEGLTPEDRVHLVKVGTFKTDCKYGQRLYGQGRIGVPTIVYHPDRHMSSCFHTPYEAYRYTTGRDWQ